MWNKKVEYKKENVIYPNLCSKKSKIVKNKKKLAWPVSCKEEKEALKNPFENQLLAWNFNLNIQWPNFLNIT